ncbi:macrolide family glycosyltransferase [Dictyobacter kobayashii]|uniref:Glycosyl transferase family 1 n=1 Tax=Dictyobacter kobayashii TaxID=2014872 RepID=A0A402AQ82_9CHLR|nr:macrolide family glycosyltransferase [Dictyobacter kobayashii]GCE21328.1 glycosyl transferase family 1 [Dictyobacter kobayashii]
MTKYAFLNAPAYGHVNPTLAVAQELVARGDQVIYYLTDEFQASIERTGASFRRFETPKLQPPQGAIRPQGVNISHLMGMLLRMSTVILPQVVDSLREEQPDCIIYDFMCPAGYLAAQILHVPAILLRPSYVPNAAMMGRGPFGQGQSPMGAFAQGQPAQGQSPMGGDVAALQEQLDTLCASYGIPGIRPIDIWTHNEELNICFIPRAFQPGGDTFDERFVFVGPSILLRQDAPAFELKRSSEEEPTLFISLGTVMNNQPDFFRTCFEAFANQPWHVVMAHGTRIDIAALGPVPANFQVAPYLPQLEVLQQSSAFITHGGMNSTMEGLYYGVPLIVVPQQPEQGITAQRVSELGLGTMLKSDQISVTALQQAVERVHSDPTIHANVQAMQQTVRNSGGYRQAADAITSFAATHPRNTGTLA